MHLSTKSFALCFSVLALGVGSQALADHSLSSYSLVASNQSLNHGQGLTVLNDDYEVGTATAFASGSFDFTGMDRNGDTQTTNFTGNTTSRADYGGLHVRTEGTVTNNYYNENNPEYHNADGSFNAAGSPDGYASLGFAWFTDTLQFGGVLEAGYKARYYFHIDGTNSGQGSASDLAFNFQGQPSSSFFDFNDGYINTVWATDDYDVNGIDPQQINVQWSTQFAMDTFSYDDGATVSGISDFSASAILSDIEVIKPDGSFATGWTVTSESGTLYPTMQAVPEPGTLPALAGMFGTLCFIRRRRKA